MPWYTTNRTKLLRVITALNQQDIANGIFSTARTRWARFEAISYEAMVYQFWVPVDRFYPPDEDFIIQLEKESR